MPWLTECLMLSGSLNWAATFSSPMSIPALVRKCSISLRVPEPSSRRMISSFFRNSAFMPLLCIWRKRSVFGVMMTRWSLMKLSNTQSGLCVSVPQKPMSAIPLAIFSTTSSLSCRWMLKVTCGYSSRKAETTLGKMYWEGTVEAQMDRVPFSSLL